jgi:hypothetical protein
VTDLTKAVVVLLCFASSAIASLERPKPADRPSNMKFVVPKVLPGEVEVPPPADAQLTEETEVFLDGQRCPYKDIPRTASIARLVLASDGKTILRIEFRSNK